MPRPHLQNGGGCVLCLCSGAGIGRYSRGTCVKRITSARVCACVLYRSSCQTAAIFVSQMGRQAGKARQNRLKWYSLLKSSIRPEKTCHVVPPFWFLFGGGGGGSWGLREGYLFLFAADKSIHTLRYSRPAKVKKSV